ncbi:SH3 domain-containing kinase-binding protein 1-like isoform X2 [Lineus longissimus]|uniref:SH3 domain-containing kinase-binding protein 1-like isoform X2 n=1 Tax=Lineus longissimus TaxID=88925 RepID=UPI00315D7ADC
MTDKERVDVLVEFEYDADEKDELTLHPGDIIRNVLRSDGGWWEGELNGKVGVFPDNFVKVIEPKEENVHRKDTLPHHRKDEAHGHNKKEEGHHKKEDAHKKDGMHVKELKNVLSKQVGSVHGPGPAQPGVTKRNRDSVMRRKKFAKVAYSYTPENQDELRLEVGEVVEVINEEEEGWWKGSLRGQQGLFPSNFVEMIAAPGEADENEKNEKKEQNDDKPANEVTEIKGKKVKGVGLGNIFGNEEIKLRSTVKDKTSTPHDETPPRPIKPTGSIKKASKVQKAKVLFGYQALNEDELTLQEGEIITVLDREIEDSGWWLGEVHGKRGVFPDNFVELLPLEETKPRKPPPPTLPVPSPTSGEAKKINKALSSEPTSGSLKKDAHDRPGPPLPGKKPELPPPMRKPSQRSDHGKAVKVENDLDAIESHENLKSLTASRPKNPNRRPPSMVLLHSKENGDTESEELSWMKDKSASLGNDSKSNIEVENAKNRESVVKRGTAFPSHPKAEPRPSSVISSSGTYERPLTIVNVPPSSNQPDVDDLRRELQHLKENTVSKVAYSELHTEVKSVREQLDKMRQTFDKRLNELMDELDEEKKIRLSTQVEMERIRRLHMSATT